MSLSIKKFKSNKDIFTFYMLTSQKSWQKTLFGHISLDKDFFKTTYLVKRSFLKKIGIKFKISR